MDRAAKVALGSKGGEWREELRATLALAWPLILANLTQQAIQATDVLLMGRLGATQLAAATLALNLTFTFNLLMLGLVIASSPMMARALGQRFNAVRDVRRTFRAGLWLIAGMLPSYWLLLWHVGDMMRAFGESRELASQGQTFLRAYMWCTAPWLLFQLLRNFVSALERPRVVLWLSLGGGAGDRGEAFKRVTLSSYVSNVVDQKPTGPIGIVTIAGMIVDGKAGPGSAGGDTIAKEIEDGIRIKNIKALVVRVDSPGGSVLASERIRQALLEAKSKKIPVVVSMGSVAASGGYWVSTPADFIYAEPSTITGSIGVFGVLPSFQGTLQKLGVGADGVKTTQLSGEPDLLKGPSPEASQLIQTGVEAMYNRFLGIVAASRHKTPQQIDQIAQGRVWDGGTAHQLGLVDGFGGMSEAITKAAQLAKLGDERGVRYLEPQRSFRDQIIEAIADDENDTSAPADAFSMLARQPEEQLAGILVEVRSILSGPSIQARCLECPSVAPAKVDQRDLTLLGLMKGWFS
jgi:signal peptide peptidase SppA